MRFPHRLIFPLGIALSVLPSLLWADAQPTPKPSPVQIREENQMWRTTTLGDIVTESLIAPDGSMTALRLLSPGEVYGHVPNPHVTNVLRVGTGLPEESGIGGSRGVFFFQDEPLVLNEVTRISDTAVKAENAKASIVYEFAPSQLTWTVKNKTDAPMQFLMVLDPTLCAVETETDDLRVTPEVKLWKDTTWFQDAGEKLRKIRITGGDRIWGPGAIIGKSGKDGYFQVWEATLKPGEERKITISSSFATPEEATRVSAILPEKVQRRGSGPTLFVDPKPASTGDLIVYSPVDYRVFQRQKETSGRVLVSGRTTKPSDAVKVRFTGESRFGKLPEGWVDLPFNPQTQSFVSQLEIPAGGWYEVEIKSFLKGAETATVKVPRVGVGEVFVTCGQSNSTSCGSGGPAPNKTQTGLVSSFGGDTWQLCQDPQPGARDNCQGGSPWPYFGDAMVAKYGVPVAIAVTGHGGAPVSNWNPGKPAFHWLMMRITQLGPQGFRALLWHQGESNVKGTTEDYYNSLSRTIEATRTVAGWSFPWFVAQVSYTNPKNPSNDSTRNAQKQLWDEGFALPGPDTDTLIGADRDGVHFSVSGLKKHGEMWAEKVAVYLDPVLGQSQQ
jgi:hypothetical protein